LIAPYRESGIVLDIGTGDGRFVSALAKSNPETLYIGIDANAKPLEKLSTKVTRKTTKGGLPNAMFVQAAVENLPEEFDGIADGICINFPWGSLLGAVTMGDRDVLASLSRVLKRKGTLEITVGIDPNRDRTELERLGTPELDLAHFGGTLSALYLEAGLQMTECRELAAREWSRIQTSWARKLGGNDGRRVFRLRFIRSDLR
jgi:16S rRNA (adenine(1408)-N(1))-methyltransferase